MSRLTKPLSVFSLLLLAACGSVERPNANACWVNAAGGYKTCYNLLTDYDRNGVRLPGAKPSLVPLTDIRQLNGALTFDAPSQKELKRFMDQSRKEYNDLKARCGIL